MPKENTENDDAFDDDDFGDFSTNDDTSKGDENATKENTENVDAFDDDDFGDFSTNDDTSKGDENATKEHTEHDDAFDDDDFGDFSTNNDTSKGDENAPKENTENDDAFDDDDFGDFSTNNNVGNEDEWGKFEDDKMGSAGTTFTEPINEVGRFSDKQRSILDAQTAELRRFGKTLFSSCFETLKVDLEQNLDIEMKTSSHLTIAMKTGQRRSASGHLFWGPSKCSKCKCLLRYVSKSCIFVVKAQPFPSGKDKENWDQRLRRRYWQL